MGLCYKTSRWLDRLWSEHLQVSKTAQELVQQGIERQGPSFAGFPADLHARLYLPFDPPKHQEVVLVDWAIRLHDLASELGEWQRLRLMCSKNGFAAGIACEAMLEQLLPHVPQRSPSELQGAGDGREGQDCLQEEQCPQAPSTASQGRENLPVSQEADHQQPGVSESGPSDTDLRATLRRAARAARDAVDEAESQLEGVTTPLGLPLPGTAIAKNTGPANLRAIRDAFSCLNGSYRLRRIAELAGRLERMAVNKARSKVRPGVGEIHGISMGDDLARLLPSELVCLLHPLRRLHLLARLTQQKALVYGMTGREPQAKGPVVVLLDESGSMREDDKDIWSKAVCLALLSTTTRQKRSWHLVAFNGAIIREAAIPFGKASPSDIEHALNHGCSGGTDFDAPITRAISIIANERHMKSADVVIITDGEADLSPSTIESAKLATKRDGVSWYAVAVGREADLSIQSLTPIATSTVWVKDTSNAEPIVPVINLDQPE